MKFYFNLNYCCGYLLIIETKTKLIVFIMLFFNFAVNFIRLKFVNFFIVNDLLFSFFSSVEKFYLQTFYQGIQLTLGLIITNPNLIIYYFIKIFIILYYFFVVNQTVEFKDFCQLIIIDYVFLINFFNNFKFNFIIKF